MEELRGLGVSSLFSEGRTQIGDFHVLGKGCVSVVVKAQFAGTAKALKVRRVDANRPSMENEASLQKMANAAGVGPRLFASSENFLVMEIAEGERIADFIRKLKGPGSTSRLRSIIGEVLTQCFTLDTLGLDHGELSNMSKHVIVDDKVVIIDFETASVKRRVSNVTSASQFLLIGGQPARKVRRMLGLHDDSELKRSLRDYKAQVSRKRFDHVLHAARLLTRRGKHI